MNPDLGQPCGLKNVFGGRHLPVGDYEQITAVVSQQLHCRADGAAEFGAAAAVDALEKFSRRLAIGAVGDHELLPEGFHSIIEGDQRKPVIG